MHRPIEELDVVEIDAANPNLPSAQIGEKGTVVLVFESPELAYEVEYVLSCGSTKWVGVFESHQVRLIHAFNAGQ